MKKHELEIEHRYQNKFVGSHRLKGDKLLTVLGSSRESDIRLLGDAVSGIHATIELQEDGNWIVCDLGSEQGTWIKKKPIVEKVIHTTTFVRIGGHQIKLTPKVLDHALFSENKVQTKALGSCRYHQIVVMKLGMVVSTELLKVNEDFVFNYGNQEYVIKATESTDWVNETFGEDVVVRHRMTSSDRVETDLKERLRAGVDPGARGPLMIAVGLLFTFFLVIALSPKDFDDKMNELKPDENKFTRMIYDAKAVRKQRVQAQKSKTQIVSHSAPTRKTLTPQKPKAVAMPHNNKGRNVSTAKVMTKIKAAGLSRLLGKISSRKSKVATFVQSQGKTADQRGLGRALASVAKVSGGTPDGNKEARFQVKGVSTAGKAGGSTSYRGIGGLASGNVGSASVGILEEETEIMGGLEKDVIAKVIAQNLGQITYCYERQLSANPELYGKVLVKFTIGATGSVTTQKIGLTTLKSAMVEGCILRRVTGWKFPKPKGGTSVLVTYPFLFKSIN
ncbi:MAG: AgmX/PglI C-terminal domain-containing protein [Bdellovibrionales bacterium]|nr:AgmX/PglI C-terminal domain-containing protein [Bdellovibrionales bacterium]